jgi:hypothetical protein
MYLMRDNSRMNKDDFKTNAKVELDLIRVQKLISHHRFSCRRCQFNEAQQEFPKSSGPYSEGSSINLQIH